EVVTAIRAVLAQGQPGYSYRSTVESEDQTTFDTVITPSLWPLLLSTRMAVNLYPAGSGTKVLVQTRSQWFILGDLFGFYGGYLRDVPGAVCRELAGGM